MAMASLIDSPLYRRKSAQDWSRQQGPSGGTFWQNAKTGEKKYQQENPGGAEGQAAPAEGTPDAKTQQYVAQLKEKFGDQAAAKVQAMAEQLRGTPGNEAKVAALEKVGAALGGEPATSAVAPTSAPTADSLAKLKDLHAAAVTDKHDPQAVKVALGEISATMSTVQFKQAAKDFGVNNTGNSKPEIADAIARKINGRREMLDRTDVHGEPKGIPTPLKKPTLDTSRQGPVSPKSETKDKEVKDASRFDELLKISDPAERLKAANEMSSDSEYSDAGLQHHSWARERTNAIIDGLAGMSKEELAETVKNAGLNIPGKTKQDLLHGIESQLDASLNAHARLDDPNYWIPGRGQSRFTTDKKPSDSKPSAKPTRDKPKAEIPPVGDHAKGHLETVKDALARSEDRESYPRSESRKIVDSLKELPTEDIRAIVLNAGVKTSSKSKTALLDDLFRTLDAGHRAYERVQSSLSGSPLYVRKAFSEADHPRAGDGKFTEGSGAPKKTKLTRYDRLKQAAERNESAKPAESSPDRPDAWHIDQIDRVSIGDVHENARKWNAQFDIPVTPDMRSAFETALGKVDFGETGTVNLPMIHAASGLTKKQVVATAMELSKDGKIRLWPSTGRLNDWRLKPEFALPGDAELAAVDGGGAPLDIVQRRSPLVAQAGEKKSRGIPSALRKSADWNEADHPRADDGKFGGGSDSPRQAIKFVPHPNQRADETMIIVDPKKIEESWKNVKDEYLPPSRGGESEVRGRREGVEEFLKKEKPLQASRMLLYEGEVSFIDGRHRMAVMRDRGESRMAVTVPKDQAEEFKKRFGAAQAGEKKSRGIPSGFGKR